MSHAWEVWSRVVHLDMADDMPGCSASGYCSKLSALTDQNFPWITACTRYCTEVESSNYRSGFWQGLRVTQSLLPISAPAPPFGQQGGLYIQKVCRSDMCVSRAGISFASSDHHRFCSGKILVQRAHARSPIDIKCAAADLIAGSHCTTEAFGLHVWAREGSQSRLS